MSESLQFRVTLSYFSSHRVHAGYTELSIGSIHIPKDISFTFFLQNDILNYYYNLKFLI